ncbi:2-C-methyl-D-erythritol 4-phosphate cytidylyltransferase [Melioribacteraceae bacterium 4301-Me]|uniref:2-C-methyl-D-erythritol 4-phosphate cytidylyltransferase n=1 Tax=Pyranulibacter aquaticus TaxID=3163344 RepID=UPI003596D44B
MKIFVIIPSAGSGRRVKSSIPKQYIKLNGKEIIAYTIELFQKNSMIDGIIVAAKKEYFGLINKIKNKYKFDKVIKIVEGGSHRQYSVLNALNSLDAEENDLIVIHDAVRPLLPNEVLNRAIKSAKKYGNVVVAIKAKDTLIKGKRNIIDYVDRKNIYYVQTPQIFRYKYLKKSFDNIKKEKFLGTDESVIVKRAGFNIKIVEGASLNFKVTDNTDVDLLRKILK